MIYKHILFVEDEPEQQDAFESAIADWNTKNEETGRAFFFTVSPHVENALYNLDRLRFDGALFDLRVKKDAESEGRAEPAGNGLAMIALKERGIPVAIITADATVLDAEVRNAGKVGVFDKNPARNDIGNGYDNAVAWFGDLWGMMETLDAARRKIESSAADIFLKRLWPRWEAFAGLNVGDGQAIIDIVTRQYVTHIADLLGIDDPENVSWHPFENYVSPALLSGRAHTGDIFNFDDVLWVVLSPQCDMATKKVENVLLAKCVRGINNWDKMVDDFAKKESKTSLEKSTNFLRLYVNQNMESSKHFLPPLPNEAVPILVHFSAMMTMPLIQLNKDLDKRIASISSPFLANIIQRFGAYISRPGQPNIDIARL